MAHLPVHGCRIRAPERSHPQPPVRWARKRRTDSNRLALVAAVVSVRISRRPAARTQSTTSPWRSCRRRRVTTTGPIIVADDIIRHWWSARRRDWRFGTLENTCRAYNESRDLIYDRAGDLSRSIDHDSRRNSRVSHRMRALYFREDAGSGKDERDEGWLMKSCQRDEDGAASFARRRPRCQRDGGAGASLILLSCNTKTRKTTGYSRCVFASRAPSRKDAVGILAGTERCAILIVTENRERGR